MDPGRSGERRAVKAGRRPPEGSSLEGPVADGRIMDVEPAGGFVVAAFCRCQQEGDACADRLQVPTGCEVDANLKLGCVVMSSPGPEVVGSEHGEIRRSQQCSITY